jgi:hypothetical protein
MQLPEISVQQMQLEIQTANGKPFYLVYVTQEGGRKVIERCVYGGQKGQRGGGATAKSGIGSRNVAKLKESAKIPTNNLDAPEGDAYREPRVSHVIQFDNYRVRH